MCIRDSDKAKCEFPHDELCMVNTGFTSSDFFVSFSRETGN